MNTSASRRIEVPRAARAVRAILANPDDVQQVFTLLEALSGDTTGRVRRRLETRASGQALLRDRPAITRWLEDRTALRSLPEGSVGRAYLAFVEAGDFTPAGLVDAAEAGQVHTDDLPQDDRWVSERLRDTHDLWHTVTGYGSDVLGEVALLGFTLAQTWNPGIGVLVGAGLIKTLHAPDARHLVLDGFRRGLRASWLPEQPWESLLALPLTDVRATLKVGPVPAYTPVTAAMLRLANA